MVRHKQGRHIWTAEKLIEGPVLSPEQNVSLNSVVESTFEPFICDGVVALSEAEFEMKHIGILRDTGAAQSLFYKVYCHSPNCGSSVLVQGIDLTVVKVPLHQVFLRSGFISGNVKLAVRV